MDFNELIKKPIDLGIKAEQDIVIGPYQVPLITDNKTSKFINIFPSELLEEIKDQTFYVEYGQPDIAGMSGEKAMARIRTIKMSQVCGEVKITGHFFKTCRGFKALYLRGHIRPFGNLGSLLEKEIAMGGKWKLKLRYASINCVDKHHYKDQQSGKHIALDRNKITDVIAFDHCMEAPEYLIDPLRGKR